MKLDIGDCLYRECQICNGHIIIESNQFRPDPETLCICEVSQ